MNKTISLLGIFLFLSVALTAQEGKDFILTMHKDTLYGKIKLDLKTNILTFEYQGDKVSFKARTIDQFGIFRKGQTHVYKTITNDWNEEIFVEVLVEGTLNLYRYFTSGNALYKKDAVGYRYYLNKANEGYIRVTPRSYKNILQKMVKNKTYLLAQFEDVPMIIQAYNNFVSL